MTNKVATLKFNLDDIYTEKDFKKALNANNAYLALHDIGEYIFRPARKHGYSDPKIQEIIEKFELSEELIGLLENRFFEILKDYSVDLDDLY